MLGAQLLLVNPRKTRRKARRNPRKGRMPAGLRRYWAGKRRLKNPKRAKSRRRRHVVHARRTNPRRNRVHRVHHRRRHSNPRLLGQVKGVVMPAAAGAVGALVLDVAYAKLAPMLPASLQTGFVALGVKVATAIGLGMLAGRFVGRERAKAGTVGAVTVLAYGAAKTYLMSAMPSLGLSGYADFVDYSAGLGSYMPGGRANQISPAPMVQGRPPGFGAYQAHGFAPGFAGLADTGAYQSDWTPNDGM